MQFKALLMPRVVRFILISTIRLVGIIAICLVIGAEVQEIIHNIQGYVQAVHNNQALATTSTNASSSIMPSSTALWTSTLFASPTSTSTSSDSDEDPTFAAPTSTPTLDDEPYPPTATATGQPANLDKRTFFQYDSSATSVDNTTAVNSTSLKEGQGYVLGTTVPAHAGGIVFSTLFRFLNVLVLFFLLLSEISPPWPVVTNFYLRYFHPLSEDASVGFLGGAMMWMATAILSTNVQTFALISAWFLFIVGVLNVLLGLIMGPSIREHRSIFASDRTTRPPILPTSTSSKSSKGNKKSQVSYPAPIQDIGFPAPAAGSKDSLGFTFAGGAFDVGAYSHGQYERNQQSSGEYNRPSEMMERSVNTPVQALNQHQRARSGKGVVTIRTPAEEEEVARQEQKEVMQPPSYVYGKERTDASSSHAH